MRNVEPWSSRSASFSKTVCSLTSGAVDVIDVSEIQQDLLFSRGDEFLDASHIVGKRPVKVGLTNGAVTVIDQGIQPGELVITDGQYRVEAGTMVSILPSSVPSS